jgi:N-methylhydantoinase B
LRTISAMTAWAWGPIASSARCGARASKAIFDFDGTDPQAQSSVNFFLNEDMFKMFFGSFTINVVDPQIVFNDGFTTWWTCVFPRAHC